MSRPACSSSDSSRCSRRAEGGGGASVCATPIEAGTVVLSDFAYRPDCLRASEERRSGSGTRARPRTFTVEGTIVDVNLPAGTSSDASLSGVEPGRYTVTCTFHPQMEATLTVG